MCCGSWTRSQAPFPSSCTSPRSVQSESASWRHLHSFTITNVADTNCTSIPLIGCNLEQLVVRRLLYLFFFFFFVLLLPSSHLPTRPHTNSFFETFSSLPPHDHSFQYPRGAPQPCHDRHNYVNTISSKTKYNRPRPPPAAPRRHS